MPMVMSRRYVNSSDVELIDMALDCEYDSLAYVLACRLEANLKHDEDESSYNSQIRSLESEVDDLECQVCSLEQQLESLAENEEKLKAVVKRAQEAVGGMLNLINPND